MRLLPAVIIISLVSRAAFAQAYTISTFAGSSPRVDIPGTSAILSGALFGVAADRTGNVFFSDQHSILRLDAATGVLTLFAGNGTAGFSGDNGPATSAQLSGPQGLAVDSAGNVYIADTGNKRIRKVSNGVITTVAGNGTFGFSGDNGPAISAGLSAHGVAVDSTGNLYIADSGNYRVRKVSGGIITTVAGNGKLGFSNDSGPALTIQLGYVAGVAVDSAGNLYIADLQDSHIRKVSNGVMTTAAGTATAGFSGDNGPANRAQVSVPNGVAVDAAGNLYIADTGNHRIRKVSNGLITTVAGNGTLGLSGGNGLPTNTQLSFPSSVALDSAGNLYIADSGNSRIRKVASGAITTVAGDGTTGFAGDNGPATSALLNNPIGIAVDSAGNAYIGDAENNRIRKVSNGVIATIGFAVPSVGVAVDSAGNVYAAGANRISKVSNGVIATVAGTGFCCLGADNGPATSVQLSASGVAVDSTGNLYIADASAHRVRKVSNGVITTFAGSGAGFSGDNGPATSAQLWAPLGVAVDSAGNVYIADTNNNRIRKVSNGVIYTVAGTGVKGFSGDNGPAASAEMTSPLGVAVDSVGNLYIADSGNIRIRKVSGGVITTVAGTGAAGFSGDNGPAVSAQLAGPVGVTVDSAGNVYVADPGNQRIRLLKPSAASCTYFLDQASLQFPVSGASLAVAIQTDASCAWAISGLPGWITVSGASLGTGPATVTLMAAPNSGAALSASVLIAGVPVNVTQLASSGCTYAISPGGQAFAAAGGTGTINVTTASGCTWTAVSTASWVTITGGSPGSGSGSVSFQVAANTSGYPGSASVSVGGLSFVVEEADSSISNLTNNGSMAQLAFAGGWTTTITLVNTSTAPVQARLNFFDSNGNPLPVPLWFPQSGPAAGPLMAAILDRTVNAGAGLVIQTAGLASQPTQAGWAQLLASANLGGFAVFRQTIDASVQEAVVPIENRNPKGFEVWFDNTGGSANGIALANAGSQAAKIPLVIHDDTGATMLSTTLSLAAHGQTSFDLASNYALTSGKRGTVEFDTPAGGQISVLGIRFVPPGAFSTVPALTK